MSAPLTKPWIRWSLAGICLLVLLAPLFGWAAGTVGYAEPLENAAEETGAADAARTVNPGLFPSYNVPGLSSPVETFVSALIGTGLTLAAALGAGRILEQ